MFKKIRLFDSNAYITNSNAGNDSSVDTGNSGNTSDETQDFKVVLIKTDRRRKIAGHYEEIEGPRKEEKVIL